MNTEPLDLDDLRTAISEFDSGFDLHEPVKTASDLRAYDDPDGTARMVLTGTVAYVKDGTRWMPFTSADDTGPYPSPVYLNAVDRLAELANNLAQPE